MDLEQRVERLETEVAAMKASIQKNTEVVDAIKRDTEELIGLFKGSVAIGRFFGPILKWGFAVGASAVAIWAGLRGMK